MTKRQRAKKYLEAIEYFSRPEQTGKVGFCDLKNDLKDFPEYVLFEPEDYSLYWFPYPDQGERITALLFCYEMTKS